MDKFCGASQWLAFQNDSQKKHDPLSCCEKIARDWTWSTQREQSGFLRLMAPGRWCDYRLALEWSQQKDSLILKCFLMRVPPERWEEVFQLLARVNEILFTGNIIFSQEDNNIFYRDTLLFGRLIDEDACHLFLQEAKDNCERCFPALQMVLWGRYPVDEAVAGGLLEAWEKI